MSADPRPARSARGRLVIVSDAGAVESLDASIAPHVRRVATLFEAVGEVAHSSASDPVEAVIIDARHITRPASVVIDALRRLDPAVFLYLLVDHEDDDLLEPLDATEGWGFDGCLVKPLNAYMLRALLGEGSPLPDAGRGQRSASEGMEAPAEVVQERHEPPHREEEAIPQQKESGGDQTGARESALQAEESPIPASSTIGDVDLVEAVLENSHRLEEIALRLIEQETGRRMTFRRADQDEKSTLGARVVFAGIEYGRLVSSGVDASMLDPWAQWLARWLALADSQRSLRQMAYTDPLTGAWNRRYFDEFLPQVLDAARRERRPVTIMVFDIDDLKIYNDRHGHEAGDTVLRETVRLLVSIIRKGDRVCRIGGDEFVVIFADPAPPRRAGSVPLESIEAVARRFQQAICEMKFPKLGHEAPGALSISAGLATFPWDGPDAESLLRTADQLAIESKRRGKNLLSIGPGAAEICDET